MIYTLAIGIEFIGTCYRGWQRQQAGVASVQACLEDAISKIANENIQLHAAGRTDAGVHASNMIAHFQTTANRPVYNWLRGINSQLPMDIAVQWLVPVPDDFHARFGAIARRYCYVVLNQQYRPAILNHQVTHFYHPLCVEKMQAAAQLLVGTHNFSSFRAAACQSNQPVRQVYHAQIIKQGGLVVLDIQANGFLHHMVRNIMGCLFAIGTEQKPITWITELLAIKDRTQAAATASADGLYFANAYYPSQWQQLLPDTNIGPVWLQLT